MAGSCQSIVSTTGTYWVIMYFQKAKWNGDDGQSRKVHAQELHFCGAHLQPVAVSHTYLVGITAGSSDRKQIMTLQKPSPKKTSNFFEGIWFLAFPVCVLNFRPLKLQAEGLCLAKRFIVSKAIPPLFPSVKTAMKTQLWA